MDNVTAVKPFLEYLSPGGFIAFVFFLARAGYHRKWVWGWEYTRVFDELQLLKTRMAEDQARIEKRATDLEQRLLGLLAREERP